MQGRPIRRRGQERRDQGLAGRGTQTFDAKGMTVVPGFIDCHNHAPGNELLYDVVVGNPYEVEFVTIQSIIDKLKARAAKTPPGYWVEGYFFDDTKVKDNRELNVHDLDKVSTDQPVAVHHRGGHTSYYNSKALQMAGITKITPNPFGGTYDKDRQWRAERPRHRLAPAMSSPRSAPRRRTRRRSSCSATAKAWPSSPSNSSNTA